MYNLSGSINRIKITVTAVPMGEDLCVVITGGNKPHLGAAALASPRPSLDDPEKTSSSASVITVVGHKEDELAKGMAQLLSSSLKTQVVVACGIHEDQIKPEEIAQVKSITEKLVQELITKLIQEKLG